MKKFLKFRLIQIDAWKTYDSCWQWNNQFLLERDIFLEEKDLTNRKILRMLREKDYLTDLSKGKMAIEDYNSDYNFEILLKGTREPVFCLQREDENEYKEDETKDSEIIRYSLI